MKIIIYKEENDDYMTLRLPTMLLKTYLKKYLGSEYKISNETLKVIKKFKKENGSFTFLEVYENNHLSLKIDI